MVDPATTATLRCHPLRATVTAAEPGLAVSSLTLDGHELLVPGTELAPHGFAVHGELGGLAFLHPWANRLSSERIDLPGGTVDLSLAPARVSRDPAGLPLHGLRTAAWRLHTDPATPARARATFASGDDPGFAAIFPFTHEVDVLLELDADGLHVSTTVRATGAEPVPLAIGWHPYLRPAPAGAEAGTRAAWRVALPDRRSLDVDDAGLPQPDGAAHGAALPAEGLPLGDRTMDDAFTEVRDGACASVRGGGRQLMVVWEEGYPAGQAFAPAEVDVVSFEPMVAPVDALARGAAPSVPPGASRTLRCSLLVT